MAHKAPTIDKSKNHLFLLRFFAITVVVTGVPFAIPLNLIRVKLDIRTKVRLIGPSHAEAGVEGIESMNAHRADVNGLVPPPFSPSWSWALTVRFVEPGITPMQIVFTEYQRKGFMATAFKDYKKGNYNALS